MVARSKIEQLPEPVRAELEQRLIAQAFGGYEALADWLSEQGFEIHKASVHRFGQKFEERCRALKVSTDQARAIVEASPDDDGAMNEALMRLTQQKAFDLLIDLEIDPETIDFSKLARAIADMTRAGVGLKKYSTEVRARAKAVADKVAEKMKAAVARKGMSAEAADEIRREILGIA